MEGGTRMTELEEKVLCELATHDQSAWMPTWIADAVLRGGSEAWPFQVRSVQGCLLRMERKLWVRRDWPAYSRSSRGWRITGSGRVALSAARTAL
jgi:hypothetical protein